MFKLVAVCTLTVAVILVALALADPLTEEGLRETGKLPPYPI